MSSALFDFTPLLPTGLLPPVARWNGRVKYDFTGGNNATMGLGLAIQHSTTKNRTM